MLDAVNNILVEGNRLGMKKGVKGQFTWVEGHWLNV